MKKEKEEAEKALEEERKLREAMAEELERLRAGGIVVANAAAVEGMPEVMGQDALEGDVHFEEVADVGQVEEALEGAGEGAVEDEGLVQDDVDPAEADTESMSDVDDPNASQLDEGISFNGGGVLAEILGVIVNEQFQL